ncbi:maleylpyruvate isomerase N-terminal domain-containing protein [Timonella sp. A28]|uniref:maleylpyruvate isomerase N-terminal domain-containing protein n=1 Tax=Timonella sp. A28 TaxID=3442640 RepID=UPI003EB82DE5
MPATFAQLTESLETQLTRLQEWLEPLGEYLAGQAQQPSSLPGWTVRELVVHIGGCLDTLIDSYPAPAGTHPLTLAEYLGTYPNRAEEISELTHAKATELTTPLNEFLDAQHSKLTAKLAQLGDDEELVIQGRRGPIELRDIVLSRLIELVVHALDLEASLAGRVDMSAGNKPIDKPALDIVADELLSIVVARGGQPLDIVHPSLWVRLATGRLPYNTDQLALALNPTHTAGGIPDLGRMLPLL